MGKLGQARKRRRIQDAILSAAEVDTESGPASDEEDRGPAPLDNESAAIGSLNILARRLDLYATKEYKQLRQVLGRLVQLQRQRNAHFEPECWATPAPSDADISAHFTPARTAALLRFAARFAGDAGAALLAAPEHKPFRRALHPFVLEQYRREGLEPPSESLSGRISGAFRARDWPLALSLLTQMASSGEAPKLGAMQRWIRDCDLAITDPVPASGGSSSAPAGASAASGFARFGDRQADAAGSESSAVLESPAGPASSGGTGPAGTEIDGANTALLLMDAVMRAGQLGVGTRTAVGSGATGAAAAVGAGGADARISPAPVSIATKAVVIRQPVYTGPHRAVEAACPGAGASSWYLSAAERERVKSMARVISHMRGPERRPPSDDDLSIYMTQAGTIRFDGAGAANGDRSGVDSNSSSGVDAAPASSLPAPPKRFDVPSVPGAFLLSDVLSQAECTQLIGAAEAIGYTRDGIDGIGALVWLADDSLLGPIFDRVRALLPQSIGGCPLRGLNARLRFFRYHPAALYRPHIDGAWPGSGLDAAGQLTDDAFDGQQYSKLTFLIYLNGGFDGGATTFFLPDPAGAGHISAYGVQPQGGAVLCFPHGDSHGLVHEGSCVAEGGVKYIIRTDVLYASKPP